ncbi:hypothetical protein LTR05_005484, partial [Lithohypha guttulata]
PVRELRYTRLISRKNAYNIDGLSTTCTIFRAAYAQWYGTATTSTSSTSERFDQHTSNAYAQCDITGYTSISISIKS